MENKDYSPIDILSICQATLGKIPFSVETQGTIGKPLSEAIVMIEQAKKMIINTYMPKEIDQNGSKE